MTEEMLLAACRKLKFGSNLVVNAKKINANTHLDFLLELFTTELEERDRKRRNAYSFPVLRAKISDNHYKSGVRTME